VIGSVRGKLVERFPSGEVIVDVAGIGYRVTITPTTLTSLGETGDDVLLHTHLHVRDDGLALYGFATREERVAFEALLGARGVGPALALAFLSVHRPDALAAILADDDLDALTLVPGVGRKTAQRLLIELKSRLDVPDLDDRGPLTAGAPTARREVREALASLGYGDEEIREATADLGPDGSTDELLRTALQRLAMVKGR